MTNTSTATSTERSPWFWGGLMLGSMGAVLGLRASDAINNWTALILLAAPLLLIIPLLRAISRRADAHCARKGEAQKRYMKRVAVSTSLYLLALALMTFVTKEHDPSLELRTCLAILPGLAVVGIFWAIGRLIVEEPDEFMRMLIIRQALVASGLALSAASIWGFLEDADIVVHIDAYWWAVVWFLGLGIGAIVNRIQYGTWGAV